MEDLLIDLTAPLDWAGDHAAVNPNPVKLHVTETEEIYLLTTKQGPVFERFAKIPKHEAHKIETVEGFLDYLKARCPEHDGIVFVNAGSIYSRLHYRQDANINPNDGHVQVPLLFSEEYAALMTICGTPVNQKTLRDLLIGPLASTLDVQLELLISSIRISPSAMHQVQIDTAGIARSESKRSVAITFPLPNGQGATETKDIPLEWDWQGRIFEAFDKEYDIRLRLDLAYNEETGLKFKFIPRRLDRVLRQARLDLVSDLKGKVPANFTVHEGTF